MAAVILGRGAADDAEVAGGVAPSGKPALKSPMLAAALTFGIAGIGFVLATLVFGRVLNHVDFGRTILIVAICLSAIQAAPASINSLVVRYDLATGLPVLAISAALGLVFSAVAMLVSAVLYDFRGSELGVLGLTVFIGAVALGSLSSLQRGQRYRRTAILSQSANAGLLLAACLMLAGFGRTVWFPAALAGLALLIAGTLAWRWVLRSPQAGRALDSSLWRRGLNFGGLAITAEMLAQIERLLIPLLLSYQDLAVYAVVAAIALAPFRMLEMGAMWTLAPRLRKADGFAKRRRLLLIDIGLLAGLTSVAGIGLLLFGPWICNFVLPDEIFPLSLIVAVIVAGFGRVLVSLAQGVASAFGSAEEIGRVHLIGWLSIAVSVVAGSLLSPFGLTGLLYGIASGWLFKAVVVFAFTAKHLSQP